MSFSPKPRILSLVRDEPSGKSLMGGVLVRCTVCNFPLRPERTARRGRFMAKSQTQKTNSTATNVDITATEGGCPHCGTFFWDGGEAGDLMKPWTKSRSR